MRLALLADIHGNLPALKAVMGELERLQPDHVIVDGDLINAVPFSGEVVDVVRAQDWVVVRGNHEFYYLDFGTERAAPGANDPRRWPTLHWQVERISPAQGRYLAMLPDDRTLYLPGTQPVRVTHGVPGRNRVGFYNEQPESMIAAELDAVLERTIVSAHTHVQVDRHVRVPSEGDGEFYADPHSSDWLQTPGARRHWHVVNPGSVGLPLNHDTGAQFAVIESVPDEAEPGGWRATHYSVPYDRRPALEAYVTTGMLEAGGPTAQLFYWELVTAGPEIMLFDHWARANGHSTDGYTTDVFRAYAAATGRDRTIRSLDPLYAKR